MKPKKSEDLAQRLRLLYKTYECESKLPDHDDLVAKLCVYPVSYEEVEKIKELIDRYYDDVPDNLIYFGTYSS